MTIYIGARYVQGSGLGVGVRIRVVTFQEV